MSAATQRTFGNARSGFRRATPTISSTAGSPASAATVLVPTLPVAPATTTRMEHGYPGIRRRTPSKENDGRTHDTRGEAGRGDRSGAGGAGRHEEGRGPGGRRRDRRRAAADARGSRGDRAPRHRGGRRARRQEDRDPREGPRDQGRGRRDDEDLPRRRRRRARRLRVPDDGRGRRGGPLGHPAEAEREGRRAAARGARELGPADPGAPLQRRQGVLARARRRGGPVRGVVVLSLRKKLNTLKAGAAKREGPARKDQDAAPIADA